VTRLQPVFELSHQPDNLLVCKLISIFRRMSVLYYIVVRMLSNFSSTTLIFSDLTRHAGKPVLMPSEFHMILSSSRYHGFSHNRLCRAFHWISFLWLAYSFTAFRCTYTFFSLLVCMLCLLWALSPVLILGVLSWGRRSRIIAVVNLGHNTTDVSHVHMLIKVYINHQIFESGICNVRM